jgi:hypothetical protein
LYSINVETGELRHIAKFKKPGYMHVSPGGKILIYVTFDEVFTYELSTGSIKSILKFENILSSPETINYLMPSWLPNNTTFRIAIPITDVGVPEPKTRLWEIDTKAGKKTQLFDINTAYTLINLSPEGTWVLYAKRLVPESDNPIEINLINIEDKSSHSIISGDIIFNSWSPDETKILIKVIEDNVGRDEIIDLERNFNFIKLPERSSFIAWINSSRYLNSKGMICDYINMNCTSVVDGLHKNPYSFVIK